MIYNLCLGSSFYSARANAFFICFIVVAFCPNNNEVHIYKSLQDNWERVHVLQKVPFKFTVSYLVYEKNKI